jgi:hypothetical protein
MKLPKFLSASTSNDVADTGGTGTPGQFEHEYFQRRRTPRNLIAEREAQGQLGLPGTDRISQAELVQRKANEPLRPSVEQKPMDVGLFGDEAKQKELFQGATDRARNSAGTGASSKPPN